MNIGITEKKIMLVFILNSDQLYAIIWAHFIALAHSMPDRRETNNGVESWMQIVRSKYRHQLGLDQFYDLVVFWFFSNSLSMFAPFEWFRRVCSSSHVLRPPLLSLVTFHEHRVEHKCLAIRYRLL